MHLRNFASVDTGQSQDRVSLNGDFSRRVLPTTWHVGSVLVCQFTVIGGLVGVRSC